MRLRKLPVYSGLGLAPSTDENLWIRCRRVSSTLTDRPRSVNICLQLTIRPKLTPARQIFVTRLGASVASGSLLTGFCALLLWDSPPSFPSRQTCALVPKVFLSNGFAFQFSLLLQASNRGVFFSINRTPPISYQSKVDMRSALYSLSTDYRTRVICHTREGTLISVSILLF